MDMITDNMIPLGGGAILGFVNKSPFTLIDIVGLGVGAGVYWYTNYDTAVTGMFLAAYFGSRFIRDRLL